MNIQYCSDLHLEFRENLNALINQPLLPSADVLVLAGDILPLASLKRYDWFIDLLSSSYQAVYWVPGNHEFYKSDISSYEPSYSKALRDNVFLVHNQAVDLGAVVLICSTLWSHISAEHEYWIRESMSDYKLIRHGYSKWHPAQSTQLHRRSVHFLEDAFDTYRDRKKMVVSHHVPTCLHYPEEYRHSELNEAFATELGPLIERSGAAYWLYGHHHRNVPDFYVGETMLITNQLGCVSQGEHKGFRRDAVLQF